MRGTLLAIVVMVVLGAPSIVRAHTTLPGVGGLDHLLAVVEARYHATPDPTDVRWQARELEHDAERIRAFVRDEIAFEPYAGALRGASGTLLARAGNALDQSLLLRDLLAVGGVDARIVGRDLEQDEGAELVAHALRGGSVEPEPPPDAERAANDLGVAPDLIQALVRERTVSEAALLEEVLAGAEREAARLLALLADRLEAPAFDAPRRHYWVQVDGSAFDPTGSDVALGDARVVSDAELEAQRTTIVFQLVLERVEGSAIESEPLLEVALRADEIAFRSVDVIVHPEPDELPEGLVLLASEPTERAAAFAAVETFRSGLVVDGRRYGGAPFDRSGARLGVTGDGRVSAAASVGQAAGGLLGGAFGGGRAAPATSLHGLRLEVRVQPPSGDERLHVRTLYRAGEAPFPMLRDSFLIETQPLPAGESARRTLGVMARNAPAIRSLYLGASASPEVEVATEVAPLLLRYADARRRLLAALGATPVFEGVGIVRESRQLLVHADASGVGVRHTLDLMDTRYAVLHDDGSYDQAAGLVAGVAETALEWLLLVRISPAAVEADRSAWTLIDRARMLGAEATIGEEADAWTVRWAEDAWWSVDRRTGLGIGRAQGGAGQGLVEYGWVATEQICTAMGTFFSLLGELQVEGQALSDAEKLCKTRDLLTKLGSDVESVLTDGHVDFIEQYLRDKGLDAASSSLDVQQQLFDAIQGQTRDLWRSAASALSGL